MEQQESKTKKTFITGKTGGTSGNVSPESQMVERPKRGEKKKNQGWLKRT